ncbi:stimulator of interferon genes protein isoform X2 [Harpegnathos saltator]|nr:stimulator of interferon genes protein isoform X2 [Harpegnathos saltator]
MNFAETNSERYSSPDGKMKIHLAYGATLIVIFALSVHEATKNKVDMPLIVIFLVTSVFIIIFVICDIILCLCQILISFIYVNQSSGENLTSILNHYLIPNTASMVVIICATLLVLGQIITSRKYPLYYVWDYGPHMCTLCMTFSFLLLRWTTSKWETSRLSTFSFSDLNGLDYGTGMAYSYYYGYLRLVLPSTGTSSKGIVEKIENFEDKHGITFPVHKLFILIPSSGYIPPDLKEVSDQWMESAQELEEEIRNRAGIVGRTYRNNVYKIYPGGQKSGVDPVYVVVEGATPLLTFYEIQKHNHSETAVCRQFRQEIISSFHTKLHSVLQNEFDTKNLCEIIYYDDYNSDPGTKINIAKLILERVSKIKYST